MVDANQATKKEPVGIQPQAYSLAKKSAHELVIQPKKIKIAAQIATKAKPMSVAMNERKEKWLRIIRKPHMGTIKNRTVGTQ